MVMEIDPYCASLLRAQRRPFVRLGVGSRSGAVVDPGDRERPQKVAQALDWRPESLWDHPSRVVGVYAEERVWGGERESVEPVFTRSN